ncbi:MAG: secondary thiamine-phosphate synthase enzyme YjbQ [Candidatus Thermoplasmatota archaeon]
MAIFFSDIELKTNGEVEVRDITKDVEKKIRESKLSNGIVCIFVPGSTGALTTIEYEPGLLKDLPEALERLFPKGKKYFHDNTWHDGNGHSHIRASFIGPSITVPFRNSMLTLGTWQQIVFIELDNRARNRKLIVEIIGE